MVDSEDEYDRKRRDKFRGERSTGGESYRPDRRDERRREDWGERNSFRGRGRPDYYRGGIRDRYSPARELVPPKRMRPDWSEESRPRYQVHDPYSLYGWGHEPYPMHSVHSYGAHPPMPMHSREIQNPSDMLTQPPMMTLKQFLDTQDDGISDSEVLTKYSEYKVEFKRQQLNEFFVAHKDEEWFKNKYHPEESLKRKEEQLGFLNKRVEVFCELLEKGFISNVSVDVNQSDQLLRLLDMVVIKLEGGTDEDMKILDEKPSEPKPFESNLSTKKTVSEQDDDVIITDVRPKTKKEDEEFNWEPIPSKIKKNSIEINDDEENWDNFEDSLPEKNVKSDEENESKKRKSIDSNDKENWDDEDSQQRQKSKEESSIEKSGKTDDSWQDDHVSSSVQLKRASSESSISSDDSVENRVKTKENLKSDENLLVNEDTLRSRENENFDVKMKEDDSTVEVIPDTSLDESKIVKEQIIEDKKDDVENNTETIDLDKEKDSETSENKPRALHRTSSIFLRNLAPAITKAEIENACKRYEGFLRVAIADPLVERRWFRRGWVTFQRDVNIKEICWNLNNIRLRDCEMGAIVNRDLSRRVRPVNGITAHKSIVRSDIKILAKVVFNMDERFSLWKEKKSGETQENTETKKGTFGFESYNPVLQNITDYIIEEASAEEDELLGLSSEKTFSEGESLERDPQLISVLDKLILYMRIVHSLDFYNHCEYPYEDEMPNRCGIIHARGPPPSNKITKQDIEDYIKNFEAKISQFLHKTAEVNEEELKNLGCKDSEVEVEKFIQANTQELSKDKWLCPLSGKKFKGPEFIRKHIFNKHGEKVDEVRKEVEYFNNYLKDPKRPQLPEHPGNTKRNPSAEAPPQVPYRSAYPSAGYGAPYAAYAPPIISSSRPRGFPNRRELPMEHQRRIIGYHDLDAPQNFDFLD